MKRAWNPVRAIGAWTAAALMALSPLTAAAENLFPGAMQEAQEGVTMDGLWSYMDYGDGTLGVRCKDRSLVHAEIPRTINGKNVTMIDSDCFKDNTALESVDIPSTVTYIEDFAFYNCENLKALALPQDLQRIDWQAFYNCSSLTEITIPASVTIIEEFVFEGCTSMKEVKVSDANKNFRSQEGVLFDYAMTELIYYPPCKEDKSYDIPDGCTKIEDWAFIGNSFLETIDLTGVTEIGEDAFYHCTALKSVEIPDGISELKSAVFGNCTSLMDVTLPFSLDVIGDSAFYSCTALKEIEIPGRVDTIGNYAFFNCPNLSTIALNDAVKTIGDYALGFYYDGDAEKPVRLPGFVVDTDSDTAAHEYCSVNNIKSTGGITQSSVFIIVMIVIVVLVVGATIAIIVIQKRVNKQYQ